MSLNYKKYRFNVKKVLNPNKIILGIATFTFCASIGFAGTMGVFATSMFHGLYVGGSGGGAFSMATNNASSSAMINFPAGVGGAPLIYTNIPFNSVTNLKNNSGIGALFLGYGLDYKKVYLGAEAFVNYSNYQMNSFGNNSATDFFGSALNEIHNITSNWQTNVKASPFQVGLDIRPGFLIKPEMLLYGRVGFASAKLTQSTNLAGEVDYTAVGTTDNFPFALSQSVSSNKIALRLGGGFEYYFNPGWSIRMDYFHINYGSVISNGTINETVVSAGVFGTGTLGVTNNVNIKTLSTNSVMIGVSHYFA